MTTNNSSIDSQVPSNSKLFPPHQSPSISQTLHPSVTGQSFPCSECHEQFDNMDQLAGHAAMHKVLGAACFASGLTGACTKY